MTKLSVGNAVRPYKDVETWRRSELWGLSATIDQEPETLVQMLSLNTQLPLPHPRLGDA